MKLTRHLKGRWSVSRYGDGQDSTVKIVGPNTAFSLTQDEARELLDKLSKVTLMPPSPGLGAPTTRRTHGGNG